MRRAVAHNLRCRLCEALRKARVPEGRQIRLDEAIRTLRGQGISYTLIERGLRVSRKTIAKVVKGEAYEGLIDPYRHIHEGQQHLLRQPKTQLRSWEAETSFQPLDSFQAISASQPPPSYPYPLPPGGSSIPQAASLTPRAALPPSETSFQKGEDPLEAALRYAYEGVTWMQPPLPNRDRGRWGQAT